MSQQVAITLFLKKVELNDLKLGLTFHYNITGRSQRQVLFFQWQGIGPARTWRSATTAHTESQTPLINISHASATTTTVCYFCNSARLPVRRHTLLSWSSERDS